MSPTAADHDAMLSAIVGYATHLIAAAILLCGFYFIYTRITPFDEMAMIKARNPAAALSLGGALLGFTLTLGSSIVHNATLVEVVAWALGAMVVQVVVYAVISRLVPDLRTDLESGNIAMGGFIGSVSLAAGIINAACLS